MQGAAEVNAHNKAAERQGYDEASFVDPDAVKDAYLCGICNDVLRNPVSCKKGHTCCGDCLNTWLDSKKTCPTCRDPLLQKKDLSENLLVREVYCENCDAAEPPAKAGKGAAFKRASALQSGGCDWTGRLDSRDHHVANQCLFSTVGCPLAGCNIRVARSALADHQSQCGFRMTACDDCAVQVQIRGMAAHRTTCPKAQVQCGLRCGASVCRDERVQHEGVCPLQPVDCPFHRHGCTAVVKRRDFDAHQVDASTEHAALVSTKVAAIETAAAAVEARATADRAELVGSMRVYGDSGVRGIPPPPPTSPPTQPPGDTVAPFDTEFRGRSRIEVLTSLWESGRQPHMQGLMAQMRYVCLEDDEDDTDEEVRRIFARLYAFAVSHLIRYEKEIYEREIGAHGDSDFVLNYLHRFWVNDGDDDWRLDSDGDEWVAEVLEVGDRATETAWRNFLSTTFSTRTASTLFGSEGDGAVHWPAMHARLLLSEQVEEEEMIEVDAGVFFERGRFQVYHRPSLGSLAWRVQVGGFERMFYFRATATERVVRRYIELGTSRRPQRIPQEAYPVVQLMDGTVNIDPTSLRQANITGPLAANTRIEPAGREEEHVELDGGWFRIPPSAEQAALQQAAAQQQAVLGQEHKQVHQNCINFIAPSYSELAAPVAAPVGNGHGDGPGEFDEDDGMYQVSFGSDSTVWAVDCEGHRVHHFKQSGELIKTIGTGTAGDVPGELRGVTGVAVSRLSNSVFISECGNDRISVFNQSDGAFVRVLDTPVLVSPYGICLSPDETTLAVACALGNCIKLISIEGVAPGSVSSRTIGEQRHWRQSGGGKLFNMPCDVRFTPDGQQLVVADGIRNCGNGRVQVLALDGSFVRQIELGDDARAVAVDAAGNIIATTTKHVKVFSPEGTLLHDRLGGLEMGQAAVGGLAIDPSNGRIAVGDRGAGRVHLL